MSDSERLWEAVNPPDLHELRLVLKDNEEQLPSLLSKEVNVLVMPHHPAIRDSFSVIHYAAKRGQAEILAEVFRLAEGRLNPDIKTSHLQWTPLHYAMYFGHASACRVLIRYGACINAVTADGTTALHLALRRGFRKMAQYLIDHGAYINCQDKKGTTPLAVCLQDTDDAWTPPDKLAVVEALIGKGASVALCDECGDNALHVAIRAGVDSETVSRLCDAGDGAEAVIAANSNGISPIHLAQTEDIFMKLFAKGASLAVIDKEGRTLLHSHSANPDITQFLLSHGAKIDSKDIHGRTPLQYAVSQALPDYKAITILLTYSNDVSSPDINGNTALHDICMMTYEGLESIDAMPDTKPSCALLNLLLLNGAKADAPNKKGRTPLWLAIRSKKYDEATVLLRFHADPDVVDYKGKSPRRLDSGWFKRNASLSSLKTDQTATGSPSMLCCYGNRVARKRDSLIGLRVNYESVGAQEAWSESSEGSPVVLDVRRLQGHVLKSGDKTNGDDLPIWMTRTESSDNGSSSREETTSQLLTLAGEMTGKRDNNSMLTQEMNELTHFIRKLSHEPAAGTAASSRMENNVDNVSAENVNDANSNADDNSNDANSNDHVANNANQNASISGSENMSTCQETTELLKEQLITFDNEGASAENDIEICLSETEDDIPSKAKTPCRPTAL